jgi:hypothetical protein
MVFTLPCLVLFLLGLGKATGQDPLVCVAIDSRATNEWCQQNCFVPGTSLPLHPACSVDSPVLDRVCSCATQVTACVSIDSRASTSWCEVNCYSPGSSILAAACSPQSPVEDRVCDCISQPDADEVALNCTGLWSEWSNCSVIACGGSGYQHREFITIILATNGGLQCPVQNGTLESRSCSAVACVGESAPVTGSLVCVTIDSRATTEWCQVNCFVPGTLGTGLPLAPACNEGSPVLDRVCSCTSQATTQCVSIDIRASTDWCQTNCITPGSDSLHPALHPACDPNTDTLDRICNCITEAVLPTVFLDCGSSECTVAQLSTQPDVSVVFCSHGNILTATSLCYSSDAFWCDNNANRTSQNYIMTLDSNVVTVGVPCQ